MSSVLPSPNNTVKLRMPLLSRFCIFAAVFFISFVFIAFLSGILNTSNLDERVRILAVSATQCVAVFILPSFIAARLESNRPISKLSLDKVPDKINIAAIVISYLIGMVFLNQLIYWNDTFTFPEDWDVLEKTLRKWETDSRAFANTILDTKSIGGLISGLLIVGCLTGVAEELFFRGSIQRMLNEVLPGHASVWITAFIFSAMHFQFFGFIPRLLLGAFFGYLYIWSETIWTSIFAHALNNSIVVVSAMLIARGGLNVDFEHLGVVESGIPWFAITSGILFLCFLQVCRKWFIKH